MCLWEYAPNNAWVRYYINAADILVQAQCMYAQHAMVAPYDWYLNIIMVPGHAQKVIRVHDWKSVNNAIMLCLLTEHHMNIPLVDLFHQDTPR